MRAKEYKLATKKTKTTKIYSIRKRLRVIKDLQLKLLQTGSWESCGAWNGARMDCFWLEGVENADNRTALTLVSALFYSMFWPRCSRLTRLSVRAHASSLNISYRAVTYTTYPTIWAGLSSIISLLMMIKPLISKNTRCYVSNYRPKWLYQIFGDIFKHFCENTKK